MISACMAVWNEEEVIHFPLNFLKENPYISEICIIVDEDTTDDTLGIVEDFEVRPDQKKIVRVRYFDAFDKQKNAALEMATKDWILWIDGDETYTKNITDLFFDLPAYEDIHAFRIPTLMLLDTDVHEHGYPRDEHTRVWRRGFLDYRGQLHETPTSVDGDNLHTKRGKPVLDTYGHYRYNDIYMKHHQFLKSDEALREKARRWNYISGKQWDEEYWVRAKHNAWNNAIMLPEEYA